MEDLLALFNNLTGIKLKFEVSESLTLAGHFFFSFESNASRFLLKAYASAAIAAFSNDNRGD